MAAFPTTDLPLHLLERFITKVEWKSYFRLQQTCREKKELAQTNRNINVSIDKKCTLNWEYNENGSLHPQWLLDETLIPSPECFYGLRFGKLSPEIQEEPALFCETIKKYRITTKSLHLISDKEIFNKEQCVSLFNLLKPTWISIKCEKTDRFEAMAHSEKHRFFFAVWPKGPEETNVQNPSRKRRYQPWIPTVESRKTLLQDINLIVGVMYALSATLYRMRFKRVNELVTRDPDMRYSSKEMTDLVVSVLQGLCCASLTKLDYLMFHAASETFPPLMELLDRLRDFDEVDKTFKEVEEFAFNLCTLGRNGFLVVSICPKINSISITYFQDIYD